MRANVSQSTADTPPGARCSCRPRRSSSPAAGRGRSHRSRPRGAPRRWRIPCRPSSGSRSGRGCATASAVRHGCARARAAAACTPRRRPCSTKRPRSSISACATLLMSSEVQAKWMNSDAWASAGTSCVRRRMKYSTALTSWLVSASIALISVQSSMLKSVTSWRRRDSASRGSRWQLGQAEHRQVDEPLDLDPQPLAHEREFGEDFAQLSGLAAVAAVQRRKCGQGEQFEGHGGSADAGRGAAARSQAQRV